MNLLTRAKGTRLKGNRMREKTKRIEVAGPVTPLTSNPFAGLKTTPIGNGADVPPPAQVPADRQPQPPFRIERTRKGGYPIFVENRAAGKTVTIIRNLSGDTEALLKLLNKYCAAGGKAFPDSIEIQGDHRAKLEGFLREKGL